MGTNEDNSIRNVVITLIAVLVLIVLIIFIFPKNPNLGKALAAMLDPKNSIDGYSSE